MLKHTESCVIYLSSPTEIINLHILNTQNLEKIEIEGYNMIGVPAPGSPFLTWQLINPAFSVDPISGNLLPSAAGIILPVADHYQYDTPRTVCFRSAQSILTGASTVFNSTVLDYQGNQAVFTSLYLYCKLVYGMKCVPVMAKAIKANDHVAYAKS